MRSAGHLTLLTVTAPRYVSLQLVERFVQAGGGRLDIAEAEVYGWGRTCARDV